MDRLEATPARPRAKTPNYFEQGAAFSDLIDESLDRRAKDTRSPSPAESAEEHFSVIVIGAGQAGLSMGYHLARRGISFVILEANERIGDVWRRRWDSLRLFTYAHYDGLDGMPFPAHRHYYPSKDEMADYLEGYAARFSLPVRTGVRVDRLSRAGSRYSLEAGGRRFEADHVIVAMSTYQYPNVPPFAADLDPSIVQLHSIDYRNSSQLRPGGVLIVGAGNSGAEIGRELLLQGRKVWMSGRDTGSVPFRIEGFWARHVLLRIALGIVFYRVLTTSNPLGRWVRARSVPHGDPLLRVKPRDLVRMGVERVGRTVAAGNGLPVLEEGRTLDVANVIWCTGFRAGFEWIDLPIFDDRGLPHHDRGVVAGQSGLYFLGLDFLYAVSSTMIQGAGRDARFLASRIARRLGVPYAYQGAR
jgi:putative flavoprotein involved in K+ transport